MKDASFKKHERIRKKKDFEHIFKSGTLLKSRNFNLIYCRNASAGRRFGIIVSKKTGKAHKRNRIKRLFREAFRLNKEKFINDRDYLVIVKKLFNLNTEQDVEKELLKNGTKVK